MMRSTVVVLAVLVTTIGRYEAVFRSQTDLYCSTCWRPIGPV